MNLTHYLSEFLSQDGIIEIPKLGTFRTRYIPPRFDENHHIFYAPRKEIVFSNEEVGNTDIVRFIAEKEYVQLNVAQKIWYTYVQALLDKLREEKKHTLEGLGRLEMLEDGSYLFLPEENLTLSGSSFGLENLTSVETFVPNPNPKMNSVESLPEVETNTPEEEDENEGNGPIWEEGKSREEQIDAETEEQINEEREEFGLDRGKMVEQPVFVKEEEQEASEPENIEDKDNEIDAEEESLGISEPTSNIEIKEPESSVDDLTLQDQESEDVKIEETDKSNPVVPQKRPGRGKRIFVRILLSVIILGLLYLCYFYYEKCEKNKTEGNAQQEQPVSQPETKEPEQIIDSVDNVKTVEPADEQNNPPEKEGAIVEGISFVPVSQQGIDVIAGFFKVKENAVKQAKRMKEMGYDAYIIQRTRGNQDHYYVSIGSFSKQSEAVDFMKTAFKEKKIELVLKKW